MEMTKEIAQEIRAIIETHAAGLTDEEAISDDKRWMTEHWKSGQSYTKGQRLYYQDTIYTVLQAHTSQDDWTPPAAPSLFAQVLIPDPDVIPEWVQPDSTNPYSKGDKVTHNGVTWESTIDGNVWEPGVYGWQEVAN